MVCSGSVDCVATSSVGIVWAEGAADLWMSENRCLSFSRTICRISSNVTLSERMLRLESWWRYGQSCTRCTVVPLGPLWANVLGNQMESMCLVALFRENSEEDGTAVDKMVGTGGASCFHMLQ